jgi:NAD dependent epimerase/dehydratase family enzyme
MNRLVERGLTTDDMQGVYIASAPKPVSQVEFMRELRRAVRMPIGFPSSSWMVRFGARYILRTDPELALYGRYVVPQRLLKEGFEFQFPELREALRDLWRSVR